MKSAKLSTALILTPSPVDHAGMSFISRTILQNGMITDPYAQQSTVLPKTVPTAAPLMKSGLPVSYASQWGTMATTVST